MTEIDRQVTIAAAPMAVAAALASSTWRSALSIEPSGAGARVIISAAVSPPDLAAAVEALALEEVCAVQRQLQSTNQPEQNNPTPRRSNMTTLNRSVTVNAAADQVWPALADFGGIAAWNPNVKASRLTSQQTLGEGITRECQLVPMGTVQERVTEWTEGRMITIEIYEFKNVPAMRKAVAVLELQPRGTETVVNMQMTYEVGLGAVGAGMNSVMMKRQFGKAATGLLAGLKHHVETGQPVDRKTDIPLAAVAG